MTSSATITAPGQLALLEARIRSSTRLQASVQEFRSPVKSSWVRNAMPSTPGGSAILQQGLLRSRPGLAADWV